MHIRKPENEGTSFRDNENKKKTEKKLNKIATRFAEGK